METYLPTQKATIEAASKAQKENFGTIIKVGVYNCVCGESFACYLDDDKTMNTLQVFIHCESCHEHAF